MSFSTIDNVLLEESLLAYQYQSSSVQKKCETDASFVPVVCNSYNYKKHSESDHLQSELIPAHRTSNSKRIRRAKRAVINRTHLTVLEAKFQSDPKPSQQIRSELARLLNLPERSVLVWFQNRRTKARANGELAAVNSTPKSIVRNAWVKYENKENGTHNPSLAFNPDSDPLSSIFFEFNSVQMYSPLDSMFPSYGNIDNIFPYSQFTTSPLCDHIYNYELLQLKQCEPYLLDLNSSSTKTETFL